MDSHYKQTLGFLSKDYIEEQDDLTPELGEWYDKITNHDDIFFMAPSCDLTIYEDEWTDLQSVEDVLNEAEGEEEPFYIANWADDNENHYFTHIFKDPESDEIRVVVRTNLFGKIQDVPEHIVDYQWHPCHLKGVDMYLWESPELDPADFLDIYANLCARYETDETDEETEDDDTEEEGSDDDDESKDD